MIMTITPNPSIDKRYKLYDLVKGQVVRASQVENSAGGKGLNVSRVASILGEKVTATGFLGVNSEKFMCDKLEELGIEDDFVRINGETRSCLAIITYDLSQTEILEPGPMIEEEELKKWTENYEKTICEASIICACGSLPKGISTEFYKEMIEKANKKGKKFLLDTSGEALIRGIQGKPFFIKPNIDELRAISGQTIEKEADIYPILDKFHDDGIKFVVVSLGKDGALASFEKQKYRVRIPKIEAVNPVGSGDSMVAGIAVSLERGYNIEETLAFASACGTANAMENQTGFVSLNNIELIKDKIKIERI